MVTMVQVADKAQIVEHILFHRCLKVTAGGNSIFMKGIIFRNEQKRNQVAAMWSCMDRWHCCGQKQKTIQLILFAETPTGKPISQACKRTAGCWNDKPLGYPMPQ